MPRLADGFVSELKDRIDLFDLTSRYVQLKKSGSSWVGLSPFNQEKTPSFYVHPQKGFFNCFSSGEKGDAITFIQKMENLDFYEAIEYLAREFNVPLRFQDGLSSSQPLSQSIRKELFNIQEISKSWFVEKFYEKNSEAEKAREYWEKEREFDDKTAQQFGIGYAPTDRFALAHHLLNKGIPEKLLSKCGLFYEKKDRKEWVSIFCGRLIIPIREKLGRICGFTARKLSITPEWGEKKAPKYINSPETPIFRKGELLFNMDLANKEINQDKDFLLVEGQLDAIRCYIEGFPATIAPQGTAFKDSQAELIRKSNPRAVVCLLDGDDAGQKAALSYVSIFMKVGLDARFASLPKGTDPDTILREKGHAGLKAIIDRASSMITFVSNKTLSAQPTPHEKKQVSDFFFPIFTEVESLVVRDAYLNDLSKIIQVSVESVKSDFKRYNNKRKPIYKSITSKSPSTEITVNRTERLTTAEDDLLYCLLHDASLGHSLAQVIDPSWLDTKVVAGRILSKILAEIHADGPIKNSQMEDLLEEDDERFVFQNLLYQEHTDEEDSDLYAAANQCLLALHSRNSRHNEKRILDQLQNTINSPQNTEELRTQLKKIRNSRNSPPRIPKNLLDSHC